MVLETPINSWQGQLQLEYEARSGETLVHAQVQAPLKVQRPFYPEGKSICHSVMLHTAGGLVGGDRLSIQVNLQPNAQALITTAAATKVYGGQMPSQQTIEVAIAAGASLEWLPQEAIVFDGANYHQRMRVELATGATWMGWDVVRLGRSARGEKFLSGEWRSHTEVWQAGQLLWVDPQWLLGGGEMLQSLHGLAGCSVVGSFAFVGQEVEPELLTEVRSRWSDHSDSGEIGVTRLMKGLLCRYRGHSTAAARGQFMVVWELLRSRYGDRPFCVPRVWQL
jgi:urease accessory protein